MKHYGDITKLNGWDLPIVDVISGGSPCQDLSVAGCRKGLSGERSSLFLEQIRIVKEMRAHDAERLRNRGADVDFRLLKPRWLVWENVPGAFSSPGKVSGEDHTGEDFQIVLKEIIKIVEPDAPDVPLPEGRKWNKSGCIYDEMGRWSIAWTQHDAQYWSVPQRRKRIALVADFNGLCAPPVLFNYQYNGEAYRRNAESSVGDTSGTNSQPLSPFSESLQRDSESSCEEGKDTSRNSEASLGESDTEDGVIYL